MRRKRRKILDEIVRFRDEALAELREEFARLAKDIADALEARS